MQIIELLESISNFDIANHLVTEQQRWIKLMANYNEKVEFAGVEKVNAELKNYLDIVEDFDWFLNFTIDQNNTKMLKMRNDTLKLREKAKSLIKYGM
jgi:hypothetical protein